MADGPILSASGLKTWGECHRKWYYTYRKKWRTGPKPATLFGQAWSSAMDTLWLQAAAGSDIETAKDRAMVSFMAAWSEEAGPDWDDRKRNPNTARQMLSWYTMLHWDRLCRYELLEVEEAFSIEIPGSNGYHFGGRMDKVIRDPKDGLVYGVDHKTTTLYAAKGGGSFLPRFWDSFRINHQIDGYLWRLVNDYRAVGGLIIDAAIVHQTEHCIFEQRNFCRSWDQLKAWEDSVAHSARRISRHQVFDKNPASCSNYGGCEFLGVCEAAATISDIPDEPPPGVFASKQSTAERLGMGPEEVAK